MLWVLTLLLFVSTTGVKAGTVVIRSGEHGNFTRLTAQLSDDQAYAISTQSQIVTVTLSDPTDRFDVSSAFRRIGRTRVTDVSTKENALRVQLSCDCTVSTFEVASNLLVIDIGDPSEGNVETEQEMAETRRPLMLWSWSNPADAQWLAVPPDMSSTFRLQRSVPLLPLAKPVPNEVLSFQLGPQATQSRQAAKRLKDRESGGHAEALRVHLVEQLNARSAKDLTQSAQKHSDKVRPELSDEQGQQGLPFSINDAAIDSRDLSTSGPVLNEVCEFLQASAETPRNENKLTLVDRVPSSAQADRNLDDLFQTASTHIVAGRVQELEAILSEDINQEISYEFHQILIDLTHTMKSGSLTTEKLIEACLDFLRQPNRDGSERITYKSLIESPLARARLIEEVLFFLENEVHTLRNASCNLSSCLRIHDSADEVYDGLSIFGEIGELEILNQVLTLPSVEDDARPYSYSTETVWPESDASGLVLESFAEQYHGVSLGDIARKGAIIRFGNSGLYRQSLNQLTYLESDADVVAFGLSLLRQVTEQTSGGESLLFVERICTVMEEFLEYESDLLEEVCPVNRYTKS